MSDYEDIRRFLGMQEGSGLWMSFQDFLVGLIQAWEDYKQNAGHSRINPQ